ncbi:PilT/PilU family type 4a pilus ATPase [Aromatoleum aromaticum]|uniref:Similar to twitching motility protein PilU n=1 Tax=Aromatoleum aromaticum (strain DSM 19018 / LMG 30748 / EbN1) TaxID=76114 RepID=Q5NYT8_AROAE|nr:PilT/PilU family type 4a pilus ATPase [Aromatoleum aromaticum]NMG53303.1 PilT/PilU family type 4a pilus ATPase [Aromatoleum aromaticum]CAI09776.1 similar to twitching motility protein PilU [Aromatoleum aromaticum EbN1]
MIFDKLFQLMAEKLASDIFISAGAPIHIKIQGVTMPINQQVMEPPMIKRMIYEMMTPEQIDTFERVRELNLSFGRRELGNFRVNLFWQRHSIGIVVRYIQGDIPMLDSLGLPPVLAEVVTEKRGLVLVVGATGSGKSTTLASMIDHRNLNRSGHILTVEDPIEYLFKHRKSIVNQREVGIDTHSWHDALRNAMRQAPDCILIGEIRDRETMQAALAYSQTGHLCLATLHANNAYHALNRIVNFFPLENRSLLFLDLAVALKCIVSQRLVRKPDGVRVPAVEILMNTRHVAELIERGELNEVKEAMQQSLAPGSQTFEQDLYRLYHEGTVTFEEATANADSPTNLSWLINNAQFGNVPDAQDGSDDSPTLDFAPKEPEKRPFSDFALHLDDSAKP